MIDVSIHAPAWGATHRTPRLSRGRGVSIHAPAWGATTFSPSPPETYEVSIHAPAWGATRPRRAPGRRILFQFTLPRGERPRGRTPSAWPSRCFNSRSRVGSDLTPETVKALRKVSIHAPAWGATNEGAKTFANNPVSIHAPAWGATRASDARIPRRGVSIHAPAWGATWLRVSAISTNCEFQFTLPRGERPATNCARPFWCRRFNSRSRVGSDHEWHHVGRDYNVSIHAPAWGATGHPASTWRCVPVSIHAPAWGATHGRRRDLHPTTVSIHAPAWGATPRISSNRSTQAVSIHAPAWGATRARQARRAEGGVSIHAPAWGATEGDVEGVGRLEVSIHAPAWGATTPPRRPRRPRRFQFTLPRGERRCRR